jgi:hypothetical protein
MRYGLPGQALVTLPQAPGSYTAVITVAPLNDEGLAIATAFPFVRLLLRLAGGVVVCCPHAPGGCRRWGGVRFFCLALCQMRTFKQLRWTPRY